MQRLLTWFLVTTVASYFTASLLHSIPTSQHPYFTASLLHSIPTSWHPYFIAFLLCSVLASFITLFTEPDNLPLPSSLLSPHLLWGMSEDKVTIFPAHVINTCYRGKHYFLVQYPLGAHLTPCSVIMGSAAPSTGDAKLRQ